MGNTTATALTTQLGAMGTGRALPPEALGPGPRQTDPKDGSIRIVEGFGRPGRTRVPVDRSPAQVTD